MKDRPFLYSMHVIPIPPPVINVISGCPITASRSPSADGSNGPSVSFAGLPSGRRKRIANDLWPDGWTIK